MTREQYLGALRTRFEGIDAALTGAGAGTPAEERDRIKRDIMELFRETEGALEQLAAFKEEIRALVDRYKALASSTPRGMAPAAPPRSDHLGSSTYVERGWSAIAAGDHARAVKELNRALELAPNDPGAESLLGWAQMLQEQYDEALYTYSKVLMKEPNNALARVNVGYVCLKKGIFGEAIEHLARAIRQEADRKAQLYAHLYMGMVYLEREMYGDARSFFRKALELGPNLIEAYWELGRAHYLDGDAAHAAEAWRKGVETNRFNPWGERCGEALSRLEAGEPVSFGV
jgi:tetratricopeptide (TPR) repeat protein